MGKVVLKGFVLANDEDLPGIVAELPKHIELTRQEQGCVTFEVTQDPENRNRFNVYEEFLDQASFDAHQARAKNTDWGSVSSNLERHYHVKIGV